MYKFLLFVVCLLLCLLMATWQYHTLDLRPAGRLWVHILTTAAAFSILLTAALQSVLLRIQEQLLKNHHTAAWVRCLPPVEDMEHTLFFLIASGFVLLTIVMMTSLWLFPGLFRFPLLQKTLLALISWAVFGMLLLGRYWFGWRGRKALYYTFVGFGILVLIYLGSQFYL